MQTLVSVGTRCGPVKMAAWLHVGRQTLVRHSVTTTITASSTPLDKQSDTTSSELLTKFTQGLNPQEVVAFNPTWKRFYDVRNKLLHSPAAAAATTTTVETISPNELNVPLISKQHKDLVIQNLPKYWARLSKFRLSALVVSTTAAGFYMGSGSGSAGVDLTLMATALVGTWLTTASAASLNQILEVPLDAQMARTRNRPLVQKHLSYQHAIAFAAATGTAGIATLYALVNPLTAALGLGNLILYSCIYTPLKRVSIANTWVGAIVGAIPPLMGATAVCNLIDPAGALLALILFSWQFPHFNALSWNMKGDYARVGYRMMSVHSPDLCRRVALRHSVLLAGLCLASSAVGITSPLFALATLPFNGHLIWRSYQFWERADSKTSRSLFRYSLIHLPAIILLMMCTKKEKNENKTQSNILVDGEINS